MWQRKLLLFIYGDFHTQNLLHTNLSVYHHAYLQTRSPSSAVLVVITQRKWWLIVVALTNQRLVWTARTTTLSRWSTTEAVSQTNKSSRCRRTQKISQRVREGIALIILHNSEIDGFGCSLFVSCSCPVFLIGFSFVKLSAHTHWYWMLVWFRCYSSDYHAPCLRQPCWRSKARWPSPDHRNLQSDTVPSSS